MCWQERRCWVKPGKEEMVPSRGNSRSLPVQGQFILEDERLGTNRGKAWGLLRRRVGAKACLLLSFQGRGMEAGLAPPACLVIWTPSQPGLLTPQSCQTACLASLEANRSNQCQAASGLAGQISILKPAILGCPIFGGTDAASPTHHPGSARHPPRVTI